MANTWPNLSPTSIQAEERPPDPGQVMESAGLPPAAVQRIGPPESQVWRARAPIYSHAPADGRAIQPAPTPPVCIAWCEAALSLGLGLGSVCYSTAEPPAPITPPPKVAQAEAPPPYQGQVIATVLIFATPYPTEQPRPGQIVSSEAPAPYPGCVIARNAWPITPNVPKPRQIPYVARTEDAQPHGGLVIAQHALPPPMDRLVGRADLIVRTEERAPEPGRAYWSAPPETQLPPDIKPGRPSIIARTEERQPEPGYTITAAPDEHELPPDRTTGRIPLIVATEAPAPYAGSVFAWHAPRVLGPQIPQPSPEYIARTEEPAPYPGWVFTHAAAERAPPPARPLIVSSEAPAPYAGWVFTHAATERPPGVPRIGIARAEEPAPYAGSVYTSWVPRSRLPRTPAPTALIASAEAPRPEPGCVLWAHGGPIALAQSASPWPEIIASAEAPPPHPGAVMTSHAAPVDPAQTRNPRPGTIAQSEAPAPYAGSVISWHGPGKAVPGAMRSIVVSAEAPAPYPGWVYAEAAQPVQPAQTRQPAPLPVQARAEEAAPYAGLVLATHGPALSSPRIPPTRSIIVTSEAPAPYPGWVILTPDSADGPTQPRRPMPAVIAQTEEPRPAPGVVLTSHGQSVPLAVGIAPARITFARAEPQPPDAGSVLIAGMTTEATALPPPPVLATPPTIRLAASYVAQILLPASTTMSVSSYVPMFVGEDKTWDFYLSLSTVTTGWVNLQFRMQDSKGNIVATKTPTLIVSATAKILRISWASADTASLPAGVYSWDMRREDVGGKITLADGTLDLKGVVTP